MAVPQRSLSMDALRRNGFTVWPGMTIYWIGDPDHQSGVSGHNPDDTAGVQAEMTDADSLPEVRALDFMLGPKFTGEDGWSLVNALVRGADQQRLLYVIWQRAIWHRGTEFQARPYTGSNPHTDHVHVSGHATDDANGSDWQSVLALGEDEPMTMTELHTLLLAILTADTSLERQVRDMIQGGVQSPANGRGLLSNVMDAVTTHDTDADAALVEVQDTLVQIQAKLEQLVSSPPGGITEAQVRIIVQEEVPPAVRAELDKTHLIG